jgi:hypothetical protein
MKNCIVLLTNSSFFEKMIYTLTGILQYNNTEDICIIIGDDLLNSSKLNIPILQQKNITIKHFPDIIFSEKFMNKFVSIERDPHWRKKIFQYHKFHVFDIFFKQWKNIFYIDAGTTVFRSLAPILSSTKVGKFLAHSDAYPQYEWKLNSQFVQSEEQFNELNQTYNTNIDYPQTTIMLFDTDIIKEDTVNNLLSLAEKYNFSKTNDQGIIALYFTCIHNIWEQIKLGDTESWYYDYLLRPNKCNKPHILLKAV